MASPDEQRNELVRCCNLCLIRYWHLASSFVGALFHGGALLVRNLSILLVYLTTVRHLLYIACLVDDTGRKGLFRPVSCSCSQWLCRAVLCRVSNKPALPGRPISTAGDSLKFKHNRVPRPYGNAAEGGRGCAFTEAYNIFAGCSQPQWQRVLAILALVVKSHGMTTIKQHPHGIRSN